MPKAKRLVKKGLDYPLKEKIIKFQTLPVLTISFICGIALAHIFHFGFFLSLGFCLFSLFCAVIFLNQPLKSVISLIAIFFSLGAICLANCNTLALNHIKNVLDSKPHYIEVCGTLISGPVLRKSRANFIFSLDSLCLDKTRIKTSGKIFVITTKDNAANIEYAHLISMKGKIYRPFNFADSESKDYRSFDYRSYLASQDIYFLFSPDKQSRIKILGENKKLYFFKILNRISNKLNALLFENLPQLSATFYSAILLGRREMVFQDLNDAFLKSGTAHILAISGMNIAIIAVVFIWFFKVIGLKRRLRLILSAVCLIFYAILTGMNPPVMRATIMAIFIFSALVLEKEGSVGNSLSLAALLMLIFQPRYIFDIGFQLSFIAVLGIVYLTPCFMQISRPRQGVDLPKMSIAKRQLYYLARLFIFTFAVSLAAWISTVPLIIYHFKMFSPVTILANIIVVPFLAFIQVSGLAFLIISKILPFLASTFAYACGIQSALLINTVFYLSRLPGAYFYVNFEVTPAGVFCSYLGLVLFVFLCRPRQKPSNRD